MVVFIDAHRDAYGVEPICAELDLPRFRGRVRTWVSSTLRQLSPLVVDG